MQVWSGPQMAGGGKTHGGTGQADSSKSGQTSLYAVPISSQSRVASGCGHPGQRQSAAVFGTSVRVQWPQSSPKKQRFGSSWHWPASSQIGFELGRQLGCGHIDSSGHGLQNVCHEAEFALHCALDIGVDGQNSQ